MTPSVGWLLDLSHDPGHDLGVAAVDGIGDFERLRSRVFLGHLARGRAEPLDLPTRCDTLKPGDALHG